MARDGPGSSKAHRTPRSAICSRGNPNGCDGTELSAKARLDHVDAAFHREIHAQALERGTAQRGATIRFARQQVDGVRKRLPITRRDENAVGVIADKFGYAGEIA